MSSNHVITRHPPPLAVFSFDPENPASKKIAKIVIDKMSERAAEAKNAASGGSGGAGEPVVSAPGQALNMGASNDERGRSDDRNTTASGQAVAAVEGGSSGGTGGGGSGKGIEACDNPATRFARAIPIRILKSESRACGLLAGWVRDTVILADALLRAEVTWVKQMQ